MTTKEPKPLKAIISGGGTGGHVFPAIAIGQQLKLLQPDAEILFVGAKGKLEMEKVPKAGFPIKGLWISGFHRKLTIRNLLFPLKLLISVFRVLGILRRFRPDVVIGVGGYASGPTLEVAARMGIPTLIQEQNSFPGITNRLLANKADRICVAYENMSSYFPESKITLTGNPVRKDLFGLEKRRKEGYAHFGLDPEKPVILLFGGSLGAKSLNQSMANNAGLLREHPEVQVLWQCGKLYFEDFRKTETAALPHVHIKPFLNSMDLAYAVADVIIARAGALTISELCLVGKPSILVPSPNVAEDHQTKNARALTEKEAAVLIKDTNAADMIQEAIDILESPERQEKLVENIKPLARPEAAESIAREVLKLAMNNE